MEEYLCCPVLPRSESTPLWWQSRGKERFSQRLNPQRYACLFRQHRSTVKDCPPSADLLWPQDSNPYGQDIWCFSMKACSSIYVGSMSNQFLLHPNKILSTIIRLLLWHTCAFTDAGKIIDYLLIFQKYLNSIWFNVGNIQLILDLILKNTIRTLLNTGNAHSDTEVCWDKTWSEATSSSVLCSFLDFATSIWVLTCLQTLLWLEGQYPHKIIFTCRQCCTIHEVLSFCGPKTSAPV